MKRWLWIAGAGLAASILTVAVVALRPQERWTSASPAAIAELELGIQAAMKLYHNEAVGHYTKALELDPDFIAARLMLVDSMMDKQQAKQALDELRKADLERLKPHEQFRVRYTLARRERKTSEAARLLDEYLAAEPKDAWAINYRCIEVFARGDWVAAASCNQELLAVDPNWVLAYNQLGYIEMAQGRFAESERDFRAYRYIASDQANPHDSLAELLMLLGRYDEARVELNEALRIKPDFCESFKKLVLLEAMAGDPEQAAAATLRAEKSKLCSERDLAAMQCVADSWRRFFAGNWEEVWRNPLESCIKAGDFLPILTHRAAVLTGRLAEAKEIEDKMSKYLEESPGSPEPGGELPKAALAHMEGVRLLAEGDARAAATRLANADEKLAFRGVDQGFFKLLNQLAMAEALAAAGEKDQAQATLNGVRAVNPSLLERFASAGSMGRAPLPSLPPHLQSEAR
ncbi:MAG: tetratricopeptide repeat protein [Acidobacteriota bacterium]